MTNADHQSDKVIQLEDNIRNFFSRDGWASSTSIADLQTIFNNNAFYFTDNLNINETLNSKITEFTRAFIAGEDGDFDQFKAKLKSYDFSSTCGLVWTTNYFAYRCRTCCLSPSMSLCSACFNNGNHVGHDFNKFKSQAGGACDCGNPYVMKEFGYCKHHGPGKLSQQREPPRSLVWRLQLIMPLYLRCVLFACWALIQNIDIDESSMNAPPPPPPPPSSNQPLGSGGVGNSSDVLVSPFYLINDLLSCGWAVQKMLAAIMIDTNVFDNFINEVKITDQYYSYESAMLSNPGFKFPEGRVGSQVLNHQNLVDAYLFVCVKLRFPENLITFLIGLLTMESYKEVFVNSYLNHYSRMASTILIHAKTARNGQDASYNMNNRIVHISVQLFSGEILALKMVKERDLHYLIVHCLLNMFSTALTSLDTNDNQVINCETPMIQNNVFWPLISDLTNLVTHKSVVDYFLSDLEFMKNWTQLLRIMQFMNFFVLKEGNHIEYETMAFFHAYTMEIEISSNSMWNLWYHYRSENDRDNALKLVNIFVESLSEFLSNLGKFRTSVQLHPQRKPLSFHLPLMRNVSCFISLGLVYHNIPLSCLLDRIQPEQIVRWFEETVNTLLGCQEVLLGYWVRNGQSVRTSTTYYIHSQFCYALIDMDIFAAQVCAATLPSSTVIYYLTDPSQLLKGIYFTVRCEHHSEALDYYEMCKDLPANSPHKMTGITPIYSSVNAAIAAAVASRNLTTEKFSLERQPLALESWLMNLCWLLDLRNEMSRDDMVKLRKEVCCELCPEPLKRSDLSHRLPEKTGINFQISPDVDSILKEVANYTAPTFDEYSGNLQSGLYTFKPDLWDKDYDPLFQNLRSVNKRDAAESLAKYRDYYRLKQNIVHSHSLWPPYRMPPPPHPQLIGLENILHCKDLSYILFCCLNMFINNDYVVTEDSLALVIHLILRSISVPEPDDSLEESCTQTRFSQNQYKVNNASTNLRYKVELFAEPISLNNNPLIDSDYNKITSQSISPDSKTDYESSSPNVAPTPGIRKSDTQSSGATSSHYHNTGLVVVQRESILSLLLKIHAKLHSLRVQSGGKSLLTVSSNSSHVAMMSSDTGTNKLQTNSSMPLEPMDTSDCMNLVPTNLGTEYRSSGPSNNPDGNTMQTTNTSNAATVAPKYNPTNRQGHALDIKAVDYFKYFPLVYRYDQVNIDRAAQTGIGVNWGDGVDYVGHLLDVIAAKNDENSRALLELINLIDEATIRPKYSEYEISSKIIEEIKSKSPETMTVDEATEIAKNMGPKVTILDPVQEKKQRAQDRRRKLIASMAQKQKEFTNAHLNELNSPEVPVQQDEEEQMYECVICQLKSNPSKESMVLLGLLCSSGTLKYMYNTAPSNNSSQLMVIHRKKFCQAFRYNLPVLSHGMIIQTCGHVVHLDCFDKYKAQRPAVTRMRRTITCPLCRRDVHHLTPITANNQLDMLRNISAANNPVSVVGATSGISLDQLVQYLLSLSQSTPVINLLAHTIEEAIAKSQLSRLLQSNEACCLLRSQLELDLVISLTSPDQYTSIARRCMWPQFITYLRKLNSNIPLVIYQMDALFGTNYWQDISFKEEFDFSNHLLLNSPSDVLLNFVPYVWPNNDLLHVMLKSTMILAYLKSLVYTTVKWSNSSSYSPVMHQWLKSGDPGHSIAHIQCVLSHTTELYINTVAADSPAVAATLTTTTTTSDDNPPTTIITANTTDVTLNTSASCFPSDVLANIQRFMLPLLRLAAVLKLRILSATGIPEDFPIQPIEQKQPASTEFYALMNYLELMPLTQNNSPIINQSVAQQLETLAVMINNHLSLGKYQEFDSLLEKLINEDFIGEYTNNNGPIDNNLLNVLDLGNEICPPKLTELPNCYDDLFNAHHSQKCTNERKLTVHNFPENGLCLICGKLICLICDGMPQAFNDHSKSCCYGIGLIIDVNTSIIHVLLNNEISQWGSVYLDYYGEEDLELKRGRPLFINTRRYKLLQQQWLTHSFKHVVKFWRRLT